MPGGSFDGLLYDLRIYNGTLSTSEVADLASSPISDTCSQPATLEAWYPLQRDTQDHSGNGLHATAISSPSLACGYLDLMASQDQYLDLGSQLGSVITGLKSYSFAAWVNYRSVVPFSRCVDSTTCGLTKRHALTMHPFFSSLFSLGFYPFLIALGQHGWILSPTQRSRW